MQILDRLSSRTGDRTQQHNSEVALVCLQNPQLLAEIAAGLKLADAEVVGDCAEVMCKVAEQQPNLMTPYAESLFALLKHNKTRVRWETMHTIGLIAHTIPTIMARELANLAQIFRTDGSVIVRDWVIGAYGDYATVSAQAAVAVFPLLEEALPLWEEKQAGRVLLALVQVQKSAPQLRDECRAIAARYVEHGRAVVKQSARTLLRAIESR
ncbi:MAG: hypothetical protein U0528_10290 [Anaerolineae bacterium]